MITLKESVYATTSCFVCALLVGCAPTTTILPLGHNHFRAITSSSSRADAYKASLKNAREKCQLMDKKLIVLKSHNTYTGLNKQQKMFSNIAGSYTSAITGQPVITKTSSSDDNQVEMKFKCV